VRICSIGKVYTVVEDRCVEDTNSLDSCCQLLNDTTLYLPLGYIMCNLLLGWKSDCLSERVYK